MNPKIYLRVFRMLYALKRNSDKIRTIRKVSKYLNSKVGNDNASDNMLALHSSELKDFMVVHLLAIELFSVIKTSSNRTPTSDWLKFIFNDVADVVSAKSSTGGRVLTPLGFISEVQDALVATGTIYKLNGISEYAQQLIQNKSYLDTTQVSENHTILIADPTYRSSLMDLADIGPAEVDSFLNILAQMMEVAFAGVKDQGLPSELFLMQKVVNKLKQVAQNAKDMDYDLAILEPFPTYFTPSDEFSNHKPRIVSLQFSNLQRNQEKDILTNILDLITKANTEKASIKK